MLELVEQQRRSFMASKIPPRFPRLNVQTEALLGKKNLKNHKRTHRALQRLAAAEKSGMDIHDGAKFLD
jgi:hypothetical protein